MSGVGAPTSGPPDDGAPNKRRVLLVVSVGVFMATLDGSVVSLALPSIANDFSIDATEADAVVTAYLIAISSTLLLVGALADRVGRKRLYQAGFAVFTVGSALCAVSWGLVPLVAFRVLQALGGSLMFAIGPAVLTAAYPARERGRALGAIGTAVAGGQTVGPVFGGILLQLFGWPSIFLVNIPVGAAALLFARSTLAPDGPRPPRSGRFDAAGAALLPAGLFLVALAVEWAAGDRAFTPPALALLGGAAACVLVLRSVERRHAAPIVSPAAVRNRDFVAACTSTVLAFIAVGAQIVLMPFYMGGVLGYEPYKMGLMLLPGPAMIAIVAPFAGRLSDRIGTRLPAITGLAIAAAACVAIAALDASAHEVDIVWRTAVFGAGIALFQSPNNSAIMGAVERRYLGLASGMLATVRTLGFALGVAGGAGILAVGYAAASGGVPLPPGDVMPEAAPFLAGFSEAMVSVAIICAAGIITAAARSGKTDGGGPGGPPGGAPTASSRGR